MTSWKTLVAVALPLLVVPTAVSAGVSTTLVFVGEACMETSGSVLCSPVSLGIETGTGTGTFGEAGALSTLTWRWEPLMKGAILDFDPHPTAPEFHVRGIAIPRASGVVGGLSIWTGFAPGFGVVTLDLVPAP